MIDGDRLLVVPLHRGRATSWTSGNPEQPRVLGFYDTYPGARRRLQRRLGRVHLPGLEPDRRQRHQRRPVRPRVHRPVILRALGHRAAGTCVARGREPGARRRSSTAWPARRASAGWRVLVTTTTHMGTLDRGHDRPRARGGGGRPSRRPRARRWPARAGPPCSAAACGRTSWRASRRARGRPGRPGRPGAGGGGRRARALAEGARPPTSR